VDLQILLRHLPPRKVNIILIKRIHVTSILIIIIWILLKLDVKFELPIYDGELNEERLGNWIKKIEVYCRVQKIMDDTAKIQLASL
jgi:hypothetical protein